MRETCPPPRAVAIQKSHGDQKRETRGHQIKVGPCRHPMIQTFDETVAKYVPVWCESAPDGSWLGSHRWNVFIVARFGSKSQVVHEQTDQTSSDGQIAQPLQRMFPQLHNERNAGIGRQATVKFRLGRVVQNVNNACAADTGRIVHAGIRKAVVILKLLGALPGEIEHVFLGAEVQATGGT